MEVIIPKETKILIAPELLILNEVKEHLDVKPSVSKITWTNQYGNEKNIIDFTDESIANLAEWLRNRGWSKTEKIIQGELERRCTGAYSEWFLKAAEEYKQCPEIWRLKVY